MNKRLDVQKVDAALKRAGHNAVAGPRSAQTGRLTAKDSSTGLSKSVAASALTQRPSKK